VMRTGSRFECAALSCIGIVSGRFIKPAQIRLTQLIGSRICEIHETGRLEGNRYPFNHVPLIQKCGFDSQNPLSF